MNTIATASQQLAFRTLTEALLAAPAEHAFVTMWNNEDNVHTTTFREFTRWAYLQAAYFREQGLQPNETVILIMPQGVALMTALWAPYCWERCPQSWLIPLLRWNHPNTVLG